MDIERVSDLYSSQMKIKSVGKLVPKTKDNINQNSRQPQSRSNFEATEVLAEKVLVLEHRIEDLELRLRRMGG